MIRQLRVPPTESLRFFCVVAFVSLQQQKNHITIRPEPTWICTHVQGKRFLIPASLQSAQLNNWCYFAKTCAYTSRRFVFKSQNRNRKQRRHRKALVFKPIHTSQPTKTNISGWIKMCGCRWFWSFVVLVGAVVKVFHSFDDLQITWSTNMPSSTGFLWSLHSFFGFDLRKIVLL